MLTQSFSIGQVHKIMSKNYIFIDYLKLQRRMVVKDIKILIRDSRCALGFIIDRFSSESGKSLQYDI